MIIDAAFRLAKRNCDGPFRGKLCLLRPLRERYDACIAIASEGTGMPYGSNVLRTVVTSSGSQRIVWRMTHGKCKGQA